jgi:transcriptional regulator with PAS, ATPase and Fis domain
MAEIDTLKADIKSLSSRIDDFKHLFTIFKSISSSLQIDNILRRIIAGAVHLCGANHGSIILFDPDKKRIAKTLIRSEDSKNIKLDNYLNNLLAGCVYDNSKFLCTDNLIETFNEKLIKEKYHDISSVLSFPIGEEKEMIGVINLVSLNTNHLFGDREIELINIIADQCVSVIKNANLHDSLFNEAERLRKELEKTYSFREVIGNSKRLQEVFTLLDRIIPTDARVLIEGESGTGKELIARILHYNGPQKEGPFIPVDCGAFPENLLESELFGYVKGAFTGANRDKPGLFEEAHNGTLFLDEITNMPISIQSKLLRALQEGEIRPVGSTKVKKVTIRIITAASDNLKEKLKTGTFREDLYYRLSVVSVNLPPLRERNGDIPLLVNHFFKKYAKKYNKNVTGLTTDTLNIMERYAWPGNIRELENVIERLIILTDPKSGYIPQELLPDNIRSCSTEFVVNSNTTSDVRSKNIDQKKADYEKNIIIEVLQKNGWNQSVAAKELGIHESTLRYRMRKFGIHK